MAGPEIWNSISFRSVINDSPPPPSHHNVLRTKSDMQLTVAQTGWFHKFTGIQSEVPSGPLQTSKMESLPSRHRTQIERT